MHRNTTPIPMFIPIPIFFPHSASSYSHAFDHPTPTSFSQLQFLSSSAASDGGSDFIQRVPKVEEKFCSNFHCCGQELDDLHHLLEHFEECHVLAGPPDSNGQHPLSATASTFDSNNSDDADTPEFDDFDDEEQMKPAQPGVVGNSTNPTLSAPPSPALSSHSDAHPSGFGAASSTNSAVPVHPLYELKKRRSHNASQSSFPMLHRKGKSRSPPSENEEAVSMTDEDDGVGHLPFARRSRQHSVDSVASISSNASTASKKRSFGAAMGPSGSNTTVTPSAKNSNNNNRASLLGVDFAQLRGRPLTSGISTPDSSVPGTPASEIDEMEMINTSGCLPPSLLYPRARQTSQSAEEMHTDEEEDESEYDQSNDGFELESEEEYHFGDLGDNIPVPDMDLGELSSSAPRGPDMKKFKKSMVSGGFSTPQSSGMKKQRPKNAEYDPNIDSAAAAMFSPLSLLSAGGNPTTATGNGAEATASAATLAAIQAAAEAGAFPSTTTPSGRVWVPNNAKPFKCTVPGCDKAYKQQNGLKYHRLHGHCNSNATGDEGEEKEEDKPFGCYVGPACGKKYKNMNGLRYHYQHSGAHGQIGLQMLANGTHPPPAYPPGHKRSTSKANEFNNGQVVMNQSTAEALLAAITQNGGSIPDGSNSNNSGSRQGSRPATPNFSAQNSRNPSPDDQLRRSVNAAAGGGVGHHGGTRSPSRQTSLSQQQIEQMAQRLQQGNLSTYSTTPIPVNGL